MSKPATLIELDPLTAQVLAAQAAALGLTVPDYLKRQFPAPMPDVSVDDADRWLDELVDGLPALPPLPRDFSTKDIYADHD